MSFGGEVPKEKFLQPVIQEQFDILRRALKNAEYDAHKFLPTLDHLDHIKTEINRLKAYLKDSQEGRTP